MIEREGKREREGVNTFTKDLASNLLLTHLVIIKKSFNVLPISSRLLSSYPSKSYIFESALSNIDCALDENKEKNSFSILLLMFEAKVIPAVVVILVT